jgi:hypothetical protein
VRIGFYSSPRTSGGALSGGWAKIAFTVLSLSLGVAPARAQTAAPTALQWEAPEECPDEAAMGTRVAALLAASQVQNTDVSARGRVTRGLHDLELTLRLDVAGRSANKTLHAESCSALADAAAWLIAVAVDPEVKPPENVSETPEPPPPPPPKPPEEIKTPPKEPAIERKTRTHVAIVSARAGVFAGVWGAGLAGPAATLGGRLGVARDALYLELSVTHAFQRRARVNSESVATFSGQQFLLRGCGEWQAGPEWLRAGPCAEVTLVRTLGIASGLDEPERQTRYWANGGLGAHAHARFWSLLELSLSGGVGLPMSPRPEFQVSGSLDKSFSVSFVSAHAELGISVRYP